MKKICTLIALLALLLLAGCRTSGIPDPVVINSSDSVRVEYIEHVRLDTVPVIIAVPVESSTQIIPDSSSHLETSLASSDAWINPDGSLGHSIKNKNSPFKTDVTVPVKDIHSNRSADRVKEKPVFYPVKESVYIEKPPSAWNKFKTHSFWFLVISLAVALLYIFRKPILRLMCRLRL